MLWLIIKQSKLQQDATECYISRKRFMKKFVKYKNDQQVRDYCHSWQEFFSVRIEKPTFTYSPLEKAFEKQAKAVQYAAEKQTKPIENRVEKRKS